MTYREFNDLLYEAEKECDYYSYACALDETYNRASYDRHKKEYEKWATKRDKLRQWQEDILRKALASVDKSFFD